MPTGCPEQTFYSFIPNIAAMWYLNSTGKLTGNDKAKTMRHLEIGYQKIVSLRNAADGSFSFWSEKSVWLTAYITKVMAHIKSFMSIDAKALSLALEYLASQEDGGSFVEKGMTTPWAESRGIYGVHGDALSAFVAITFLESKSVVADFGPFSGAVKRILDRVIAKMSTIQEHHVKAMYAYAFALNNDKEEAEAWLKDLMDNKKESENQVYWEHKNKPLMVETAAYAVMAYVKIGQHLKAWPIVNWMMSNRNFGGGFYSTTDTVIGMQALGVYAEKVYSSTTNMTVELSQNNKVLKTFELNNANAFKLQVEPLHFSSRNISIQVVGADESSNGFAYIQIAKSYYSIVNATDQFVVSAIPQAGGPETVLKLNVCANFKPIGNKTTSGMTLIEVQLPSGYEYDSKCTDELLKKTDVKVSLFYGCLSRRTVHLRS